MSTCTYVYMCREEMDLIVRIVRMCVTVCQGRVGRKTMIKTAIKKFAVEKILVIDI